MSNKCSACDETVSDFEIKNNPEEWSPLKIRNYCKLCKSVIKLAEDKYKEIPIPDENEENAYGDFNFKAWEKACIVDGLNELDDCMYLNSDEWEIIELEDLYNNHKED